jgi:hypothetical protein
MKKMFAVVLLVSATMVACGGGKKSSTTPQDKTSPEMNGGTGGAAYGGATYGGHKPAVGPAAGKDAANPCAPK